MRLHFKPKIQSVQRDEEKTKVTCISRLSDMNSFTLGIYICLPGGHFYSKFRLGILELHGCEDQIKFLNLSSQYTHGVAH